MLSIEIKTIPHGEQRYPTVGDWWWADGVLKIRVSSMGSWKYEFLVAFHELLEAMVCRFQGVGVALVDAFDMKFESDRALGLHPDDAEPGDDVDAPYHMAHTWATNVERIAAVLLGVNWATYDETVVGL